MAHLRALVTVAVVALGSSAHAFVFPSPPPGFGGTPGNWTFSPPSGAQQIDSIMRQPAHLPVPAAGGGNVKLPVAYRLGATAGRVAAAAIYLSPHIRTAAAIATWLGLAKISYDAATGKWTQVREGESEKWQGSYGGTACLTDSPVGAIRCALEKQHKTTQLDSCSATVNGNVATGGCRYTPTGTFLDQVANLVSQSTAEVVPIETQEEFEDALSPQPMPQFVPGQLPYPTPLPVEQPIVNPTPGPSPLPSPYFVPTGDPVANPQFDPAKPQTQENQPYVQPGVRIKPSPTLAEPFRLDLEPVNVPKPTAEPTPEGGTTDPGTQPKPEDQQSLCEKHPDIVACQKLGELQPETLQTKTVTLTIERSDGFGPSTGTCPAPKTATIMGKQVAFQWDLLCDFANGIRPLLIGFAYLSAALAFMGLTRRGD